MATEFKLPPLGENLSDADVVNVLVKAGDTIRKEQAVLEAETEKAAFEVPSTVSGTVREVHVKAGDRIKVGQLILTVEEGEPKEDAGEASKKGPEEEKKAEPEKKQAKEKNSPASQEQEPAPKSPEPKEKKKEAKPRALPSPEEKGGPSVSSSEVYASPLVRRMARELGLDLVQVKGTGPRGRITSEDLKVSLDRSSTPAAGPKALLTLPDFSKWGPVERKPMTNVRRKTAEHVSRAWNAVPHVTQFDKADITELEQLRKRFAKRVEEAGGHLSMTAIVLKVAAAALKVFPQMNASVDLENEEIVYKSYFHIGIAVDTERGLIVPVIRDVDQKNIMELSVELKEVAEKARTKKTTLEEMQGATFTITNLGNIGGGHFTPIINWPEVAILGIGRAAVEPVWTDEKFEPRTLLPLSLSYDHRLVDGADGARFLRWLAEAVTEPFLMDLEG